MAAAPATVTATPPVAPSSTVAIANGQQVDRKDVEWAFKKDVAWYRKDLPESLVGAMRPVLEGYAGVPAEDVVEHVMRVRDLAWDVYPYGSVGMFGFLHLNLPDLPEYPEILERVKAGQTFLDLGCCFGQEIRKLIHDGAPSTQLHGVDLHQGFMDVGKLLFRDSDTIQSHFVAADIFDDTNPLWASLAGTIDVLHAGSFFHLFDRAHQVQAARRVVELLRPRSGSLFVGRHAGDVEAGEKARPGKLGSRYRHNAASWERLWREVADQTDTRWECAVEELPEQDYFAEADGGAAAKKGYNDWKEDRTRRLQFSFRRLE